MAADAPGPGDGAAGPTVPWRRLLLVLVGVFTVVGSAAIGLGTIAWVLFAPDRDADDLASAVVGGSQDEHLDGGYAVWARNDDGGAVRWDPCSPIDIVVAPERAPEGGIEDLAEAVTRLREATGLDLVVTGTTDERPRGERAPYQPDRYGERWAPVLVAWASPGTSGLPLRDVDRGIAIPVAVGAPGDRTYVSGQVVLNADRRELRAGFEDRADSWGATITHELTHVLGLAHADDPAQLMAVYPGDGAVEFGSGDRAGLRAIGAEHGCRPIPTARTVEVVGATD